MLHLLATSIIWAFSFPLIGHRLAGIDPFLLGAIRLLISLLVFLPFATGLRKITPKPAACLLLTGTVQYGLMYICYLQAFRYLQPHEVALFTILTPFYATLAHDLLTRRFHPLFLATSLLAVIGAALVKRMEWTRLGFGHGFLLVQASNLCFACGQIYYRHLMRRLPHLRDVQVFWLLYAGACLAPLPWLALRPGPLPFREITHGQWMIILYLGAVASGLCFFLWNRGARRVDAGALAIFNNLKIPLAMLVSLLFFGERTDPLHLLAGGGIILLALVLNERLAAAEKARKGLQWGLSTQCPERRNHC